MGLWIVEPSPPHHVPGTVKLYEREDLSEAGPSTSEEVEGVSKEVGGSAIAESSHGLKRGSGADSHMFLVPQPSDSPNDPLNWPVWKKDLTLFVICLATAVGGTVGPALAPVNGVLVKEFKTDYTTVANFSGYQFMASGAAGLLCEVMARLWGKRPIYILSTAFLFVGSMWNIWANSVGSFMGARVLQGIGLGAFETLVVSSIGDIYFVHQRGKRIALYNLLFLGTTYFMPVIAGYVSVTHGWRMQFKIISAFLGPCLLLVFLFCPEHAYNRPVKFQTDYASQESLNDRREGTPAEHDVGEIEKKKTFLQELRIYNGRFTNDSFFKLLAAPFPCMLYPATIWAFLFQGTFVTWGIGVSVVLALMFSGPPYNFDPKELGYIYAAPCLGAIAAYIVGSFFADSTAKWLARKNNNIYEPEFRIFLVIPVLLTGIPGLIAYGHVVEMQAHWIVPSILYGLLTFAVVMSCTATYAYVLDAHRDLSVEMMVAVLLLKNFFAWGSTYYLPSWIEDRGSVEVFETMGGIQAAICVLSAVMYFYGKVFRDVMHKWGLLKRLGLYPDNPEAKQTMGTPMLSGGASGGAIAGTKEV